MQAQQLALARPRRTPKITLRRLSRRVAILEDSDAAWYPKDVCPQGHDNECPDGAFGSAVGQPCRRCVNEYSLRTGDHGPTMSGPALGRAYDRWERRLLAAHPEWHVQRGDPKEFAENAQLVVPIAHRLAAERGIVLRVLLFPPAVLDPGDPVAILVDSERWGVGGATLAEAMARFVVEARKRWR